MSNTETRLCGCTRPLPDGLTLCPTCKTELEQQLGETPWLIDQLDVSLTGARAVNYQGATSRSATTPLPWNEAASRAAARLLHALSGAVWSVGDSNTYPKTITAPALSRWLLRHLDDLVKHDDAWAMYDRISQATARARAIVFWKRPDRIFLGPCTDTDDHDTVCHGDVFADENAVEGTCEKCAATYDVSERRRWLDEALADRLLTAAEIADHAVTLLADLPKLHESTARKRVHDAVRQWAKRGLLIPAPTFDGITRYRYADVRTRMFATYGDTEHERMKA